MTSSGVLLPLAGAYLAALFAVAWLVEHGRLPRGVAQHPAIYSLALGVYASSWTYYGSVGLAKRSGLQFLAIYIGPTLAVVLAPVLFARILRLTREHQLGSLADLFAFRFRSKLVGLVVTVASFVASLPYIALQIRAIVDSLRVVTGLHSPWLVATSFCAVLAVFAVVFGTRNVSARGQQDGLLVAIALESVVKLVALVAVGLFAVFGVFGGEAGLEAWLAAHPEMLAAQVAPVTDGSQWTSLLVLSFAAIFLLPRQFHVAFAEGTRARSLRVATWAFPLFLVLLNLPILPILWAGLSRSPDLDPDFFVLSVAQASSGPALPVLAFIGGVSAASAMVLVTTLALSAMCLTHLVVPALRVERIQDLYGALLWARRGIIVVVLAASLGAYALLEGDRALVEPGVVSFIAFAQFLPGMVGVLVWRRATKSGLVAGLAAGMGTWGITSLVPLVARTTGAAVDPWTLPTFASLGANALVFACVSLATKPTNAEVEAASLCVRDEEPAPARLKVASTAEVTAALTPLIGERAATLEVARALSDLGLAAGETHPAALRALSDRLEKNLTGVVGPLLSRLVLDEATRADHSAAPALVDQLRFLDAQLRAGAGEAEVDVVRRYLRALFDDLPLGVCAVGVDGTVTLWNRALEKLTAIPSRAAAGLPLGGIAAPWGALLERAFAGSGAAVDVTAAGRSFVLRRASIAAAGAVLVVEDVTERLAMQSKLAHQDRLASLGRFAAGIAHEIGNPLTGIACIAQNLRHEVDPAALAERSRDIVEQTQRIDAIVRSLTQFTHAGVQTGTALSARWSAVPLHGLVDEAIRLVRLDRSARALTWDNAVGEDEVVVGDRQRLLQVFVNLLSNASDASEAGGKVDIRAESEGEVLEVRVRDHGAGIDPQVRSRLFEPFVTTKEPGKGTGLGLSVAYAIVEEHGGTIEAEDAVGGGAELVVRLKTAAATLAATAAAS
jgi:Na+/proline symporter/signal transduction histidine kinase